MKKIIRALEKQERELRSLIQSRQDKAYDRSEKWQESEAGGYWEFTTEEIESQADELFNVIDNLKEL